MLRLKEENSGENVVTLVTPNMKSASSGKMEKFAISRFFGKKYYGPDSESFRSYTRISPEENWLKQLSGKVKPDSAVFSRTHLLESQ
jgi:hypothetical protein